MVSWALYSPSLSLLCFCLAHAFVCSMLPFLTLRHSAPVCSCHRDSFTLWRLALAQEAARVVPSASSQLFFCSPMCLVISGNLRGRSLQARWTYESPASLVNLFFTHCFFLCLTHSSRPCNRDTPGGARNVLLLGAFECALKDRWRTNHTNFLDSDSLVCDFSFTCVVTFKPIHLSQALCCCCLGGCISYVRLGLSMETFLDPCW